MIENAPSLDEFKAKIEALWGRSLTGPASEAAEDFWKHWSSFHSLIAERSLAVHIDPLRLGINIPPYKRYHLYKGACTAALLLGIVVVWFIWQLGAALIAAAIGLDIWCGRLKFDDAKKLAEELIKGATLNPANGGYAKLCANYIAGTIRLVSPAGSARWPEFPSNAVTGEHSLIST